MLESMVAAELRLPLDELTLSLCELGLIRCKLCLVVLQRCLLLFKLHLPSMQLCNILEVHLQMLLPI